jgi:hypothetical protein
MSALVIDRKAVFEHKRGGGGEQRQIATGSSNSTRDNTGDFLPPLQTFHSRAEKIMAEDTLLAFVRHRYF